MPDPQNPQIDVTVESDGAEELPRCPTCGKLCPGPAGGVCLYCQCPGCFCDLDSEGNCPECI